MSSIQHRVGSIQTRGVARVPARPIREIVQEAIEVLRQDASEYAYIGLLGAVPATLSVLVPGLIGGAVALSLIGPLVVVIALLTFATSAAAFGCVANHLQPDAASAFAAALRRGVGLLRPWLALIGGLWTVSFAAASFADYLGPVPGSAIVAAIVTGAIFYAFPRSLCTPALFDQNMSSRNAELASLAIVRREPRRAAVAWCIVLAPAILASVLCIVGGLDTISGAVVVFFFVASMPFAAGVMALLFFDAASRIDLAPQRRPASGRPEPARPTQRRM